MRLSDRFDKLMAAGRPGRISGTITGRGQGGIYTVRTSTGAVIRAEGGKYAIGDPVTVWDGRILGHTGGNKTGKIYKV